MIALVATLVVKGVELLKFIVMLFFCSYTLLVLERLIKGTKECGGRDSTKLWYKINCANLVPLVFYLLKFTFISGLR